MSFQNVLSFLANNNITINDGYVYHGDTPLMSTPSFFDLSAIAAAFEELGGDEDEEFVFGDDALDTALNALIEAGNDLNEAQSDAETAIELVEAAKAQVKAALNGLEQATADTLKAAQAEAKTALQGFTDAESEANQAWTSLSNAGVEAKAAAEAFIEQVQRVADDLDEEVGNVLGALNDAIGEAEVAVDELKSLLEQTSAPAAAESGETFHVVALSGDQVLPFLAGLLSVLAKPEAEGGEAPAAGDGSAANSASAEGDEVISAGLNK